MRGGVTASSWKIENRSVNVGTKGGLSLSFTIDSKGGGQTGIRLEIGPKDFSQLIQHMSQVDYKRTMTAMAAELSRQTELLDQRESQISISARNDVVQLAVRKFHLKPSNNDGNERTVLVGVKALVTELNKE